MLINVGPAKPSRKLSEAERKALLSPDSPLSAHNQPHRLLLETSFTNQNLETSDDLNRSSGCYSNTSEANSLSWDYERSKLMPVPVKAASGQLEGQSAKPYLKLDLNTEDWQQAQAPLATPETLSDTSSVESGSLKRPNNGYQRLTSGIQRMAPIQQSPLRQVKADKLPGYCYYVQPPSPVDYAELSPLKDKFDFSSTLPNAHSTPVKDCTSNDGNNGSNTITTMATVETSSALPMPPKPPRINHLDQSENKSMLNKTTSGVGERNSSKVHFDVQSSDMSEDDEEAAILDRDKSRSNEKLIPVNGPLMRNGMDSDAGSENQESLLSEFDRHSPEFGNQVIYDSIAGHYSHAGRGYPHGGYQAIDMTESESHLPQLAQEMELIRAPEEDDLTKVADTSALFDGSQRSRLRCYSSPDTRCSTTPEDEYGRRLSQPCSDEVFVEDDGSSWLQESDV